ncbi:hypothetical protein TanjilG_32843 [Lupinus angustifolius]|uniref:Mitochondrial glycoprotein family protein n=1 Tax=Lupinus angustifolius TaxID=3871 RepID=A0A4P1RRV7_LUPAN|nr:PREDICTED: uncharacterized protein At2g39795, mitochondrial [Lupinus angustifolius]OIW16976.1 hypothetical protein TanjilG_32843 [Lupinus angustifolius]
MAGTVIRSAAQNLKSNYSPSSFLTILKNGTTTRSYASNVMTKSPFDSNILRILRNEIDYYSEYLPPPQPIKFKSFRVEERPSEQVITIRGKFGEREDIKIQATMYDGYQHVPVVEDDSSKLSLRLHLSLLVDISKGECGNDLQFVCSAWPDSLDVEKVYVLRRPHMPRMPYLGPNFRNLNAKIQEKFREYLDARGVNNELSAFLHEYMMNKDRIELLRWMDGLKYFMEK